MNSETPEVHFNDVHAYATPELSYVGNKAYHFTLIEVRDGKSLAYVRIHKNRFHHFSLEFIKPHDAKQGIVQPAELSGTWTQNNGAIRALKKYCDDHGWTMALTHISKDGKDRLGVNLKAV